MRFRFDHEIPLIARAYWDANNGTALETFQAPRLNLKRYVETARESRDGLLYRRIHVEPDLHLPAPIAALVEKPLGNRPFSYEEERFIPPYREGRNSYRWEIHPAVLADKVKIAGEFIVEPIDERRCRRILDAEVTVKIFGVGGLVEKFAANEIRKSYDKIPRVVGDWAASRATADQPSS